MMAFWKLLNAGWFSLAIGTVIGIVGLVCSYYWYRKGLQVARLSHLYREISLISSKTANGVDGLEITVLGQKVPQLTTASYGIWNSGTTTVRREDIVLSDPIRITFADDAHILKGSVEASTRPQIDARIINTTSNAVVIDFEFLDPGDGFRIQVLHTGEPGHIAQFGTIKGLPSGVTPFEGGKRITSAFIGIVLLFMVITLPLMLMFVGFLVWAAFKSSLWAGIFASISVVVLVGLLWWENKSDDAPPKPRRIKGVPSAVSEDRSLRPFY